MKRSIVLTPLVPDSESDLSVFEESVRSFAEAGTAIVEYYSEVSSIQKFQKILNCYKQKGIYLHAISQKRHNVNLSSISKPERRAAVDAAITAAHACVSAGVDAMLITSGTRPNNPEDLPAAMSALRNSLLELLSQTNLPLLLEPGDTKVHMCQTIGRTDEVICLMEDIHHPHLTLTMDTSHLAQLGEEPMYAIRRTAQWCRHIHLANCVLKPGHPLYGDHHPFFAQDNSVYTSENLHNIMDCIPNLLGRKDFVVGVEVISCKGTAQLSIARVKQEAPWFFY